MLDGARAGFRHAELADWPAGTEVDDEALRALVAGDPHLYFGGTPELARLRVARAFAARDARGLHGARCVLR